MSVFIIEAVEIVESSADSFKKLKCGKFFLLNEC